LKYTAAALHFEASVEKVDTWGRQAACMMVQQCAIYCAFMVLTVVDAWIRVERGGGGKLDLAMAGQPSLIKLILLSTLEDAPHHPPIAASSNSLTMLVHL
jgi:hypothetical protein